MQWLLIIFLISGIVFLLYRYNEIVKLVKTMSDEVDQSKSELDLKIGEFEMLQRLYNQVIDTAIEHGYVIETSQGYRWRSPVDNWGSKPTLVTVNGENVNETKA